MSEQERGGSQIFFLFPPPLPVCGDLLIVQTCLLCKIRNKCVGSRGRLAKKQKKKQMFEKNKTKNKKPNPSAASAGES